MNGTLDSETHLHDFHAQMETAADSALLPNFVDLTCRKGAAFPFVFVSDVR